MDRASARLRPPGWTAVLAIALAVATAGCGSSTATPSAGPTSAHPTVPGETAGPTDGTSTPSATGTSSPTDPNATPSATAPPSDQGARGPLPEPSLTEPFDVGGALYDPYGSAGAVVSLLALMGVAIVARDGTVLRAGADRGIGDYSLTEDEVWGLIEMGAGDLAAGDDEGGLPYSFADLFAGLASSLPGASVDALAAAYGQAYTEHPDDLVAQVMLAQPIEPATQLTRVQMWLLLLDGFAGPSQAAAPTLGTARAYVPPLVSPVVGLSDADWAELVSRLPTLAYTIDFTVAHPDVVQEGVGAPGEQLTFSAVVAVPAKPIVSSTGQTLLAPAEAPPEGLAVTWDSADASALSDHGTLDGSLGTPSLTDASGAVRIGYTPIQEVAGGAGEETEDLASLLATVDQRELVAAAYQFAPGALSALPLIMGGPTAVGPLPLPAANVINGRRTAGNPTFRVKWHSLDTIKLRILNEYDVRIALSVGVDLMDVHRTGTDIIEGTLTRRGDGTYRGVMKAHNKEARADGTLTLPLASGECHNKSDGTQDLYVVGNPTPGSTLTDPDLEPIFGGSLSGTDMILHFYPYSYPESTTPGQGFKGCQELVDFRGGPLRSSTFVSSETAYYLPLNDTKLTDPFIGLRVHLPAAGGPILSYQDLLSIVLPDINSVWDITVTRSNPTP